MQRRLISLIFAGYDRLTNLRRGAASLYARGSFQLPGRLLVGPRILLSASPDLTQRLTVFVFVGLFMRYLFLNIPRLHRAGVAFGRHHFTEDRPNEPTQLAGHRRARFNRQQPPFA